MLQRFAKQGRSVAEHEVQQEAAMTVAVASSIMGEAHRQHLLSGEPVASDLHRSMRLAHRVLGHHGE